MKGLVSKPLKRDISAVDRSERISLSKYLSYLLRHHPESLKLEMDRHGWVRISELIEKARAEGTEISRERIRRVMEDSDKNRFRISEDGRCLRAGYGHSIEVDLGLEPAGPPEKLWHGTARRNLDSIRRDGLLPGSRQYVHLSASREVARQVGGRHGSPVILEVNAGDMHRRGHRLYPSDSEPGIWLTEMVPVDFIIF